MLKNQFIPRDLVPTLTETTFSHELGGGECKEDRNDQTGPESSSLVLVCELTTSETERIFQKKEQCVPAADEPLSPYWHTLKHLDESKQKESVFCELSSLVT